MGAGDRLAEKEAAFTCIMITDLFLAAGEKGDESALGDHLQVDDEVEVMRMLENHMPLEIIVRITGQSEDDIKRIAEEETLPC